MPSLAMAQSSWAVLVTGKNRLVALAVFGVAVWYLNVTVLLLPIDHEPVNVQTRKGLPATPPGIGWSNVSPGWVRLPASTVRTALAIRWAAGRENDTKDLPAPCPPLLDAPWLMRQPSTMLMTSCVPVRLDSAA